MTGYRGIRKLDPNGITPSNKQRKRDPTEGTSFLCARLPRTRPPQPSPHTQPRRHTIALQTQPPWPSPHGSSSNIATGSAMSCSMSKKGRGQYRSIAVDMKTKHGGKILVEIPDEVDRAVGDGARDLVNYCGLIMRNTVSFRDGDWQEILGKHGQAMWLKVKDKFEVWGGKEESVMKGFVISTMQRLFRAWKTRLHVHYKGYDTDKERLANQPKSVSHEDWQWLVQYFGSNDFKVVSNRNKINRGKQTTRHSCGSRSFAEVEESTRDPITGEKAPPDRVWELQHTYKNKEGDVMWSDPHSQQIHARLQEIVNEQRYHESEHSMDRDQILSTVLGERSGYVRGKGYGKKPLKRKIMGQANIDANVSFVMESVREQMQADVAKKLEEERVKMRWRLQEEMDRKLEEERVHMRAEIDQKIQAQLTALMATMQQNEGWSMQSKNNEKKRNRSRSKRALQHSSAVLG